ncbi:MAG: hypothetical protein PHF37_10160 [Phycisphaerae bacterium]|nr:hypothetical protein [Phycisphaerae bacterium]
MAKREKWNPLKSSYIDSKKVNRCSFEAETLFIRLIAACDDNSNFDGNPSLLACKLYAEKIKHGTITFQQVEQMRNELVTNMLLVPYEVDGEQYLHIPNNKKFRRSDILPDIRFPNIPQVVLDKWFNENVTDSLRTCNENVTDSLRTCNENVTDSLRTCNENGSSQTNKTIPKTKTDSQDNQTKEYSTCEILPQEEPGLEKALVENSSTNPLILGLKFWELFEKKFSPMTNSENTTFHRLATYLAQSNIEYDAVVSALNDSKAGKKKAALFVQLCKDRFGFSGMGKVSRKGKP